MNPRHLIRVIEKLLFSCSRFRNVDRGIDPLVHQGAVQMNFHVSGTLELFKDHLIHLAAGIHQSRRNDRQASPLFQIPRRSEKSLRFVQRIGIHTPGENLSAVRLHRVIGPRQTGDAIQKDHHIRSLLRQTLRPLNHHLRNMHMSIRGFIKGRANHLPLDRPSHIRHLFRALINQKHDQMGLRIIRRDGIGDLLH